MFLFTSEFLLPLTGHPSRDVRFWALDRLALLWPREGIQAFRKGLKDKDDACAMTALDGIEKVRDTEAIPILREFYFDRFGAHAGAALEVIAKLAPEETDDLVNQKWSSHRPADDERDRTYAALAHAETVEGTDLLAALLDRETDAELKLLGLGHLLRQGGPRYFKAFIEKLLRESPPKGKRRSRNDDDPRPRDGSLWGLALELASYTESTASFVKELRGKRSERVGKWYRLVEEVASKLEEGKEGVERPHTPSGERDLEIMRTIYLLQLDSKLKIKKEGAETFTWPSELQEDRPTFLILSAVLETLQSNPVLPAVNLGAVQLLATHAWCTLMEGIAPYDLPIPESPADCLNLVTRAPYRLTAAYEREIFEKILKNLPADTIIQACREAIEQDPESLTELHAVRLVRRIPGEGAIRALTEALDPGVDELSESEAMAAVAERFEEAIPVFEEILSSTDDHRIEGLYRLLEDFPRQGAIDLLVRHFDALWLLERDELMDLIDTQGAREYIPLLKREYREGEGHIARVLRLLCDIHGVADPGRPAWNRDIERMEARYRGGRIQETTEFSLDLQCTKCGKRYEYVTRNIVIPTNDHSPDFLCAIEDDIVCKNCGVRNFYDLTSRARTQIITHVMLLGELPQRDKERAVEVGPIRWVRAASVGWGEKEQSLQETLKEYDSKLQKTPRDPALMIGYANLLKKMRRRDEAADWYAKAVAREPSAVEALFELGIHHRDLNEKDVAMQYFEEVRVRLGSARFYRTGNPDMFPMALAQEMAALKGVVLEEPVIRQGQEPRPSYKVGRNDPCPCGSGKKFKKCCLGKGEGELPEIPLGTAPPPYPHEKKDPAPCYHGGVAEEQLEKKLAAYADTFIDQAQFDRLAKKVVGAEPIHLPPENNPIAAWLQDSLYYSMKNPERGGLTLMEAFKRERGADLGREEAELLDGRLRSRLGFYQLMDVKPGEGMEVEDILLGGRFEIHDRRASKMVVKWDILHARIVPLKDFWIFATAGVSLPATAKPILERGFREAFTATKSIRPGLSEEAFIKEDPIAMLRIAESYWKEQTRKFADIHTPEGDAVAVCHADYACDEPAVLADRLSRDADVLTDEEVTDQPAERSRTFTVLMPAEKESRPPDGQAGGVSFDPHVVAGRGGRRPILGTVTICDRKIRAESFSVARLKDLKQRLESIKGAGLRFLSEVARPARAMTERRWAEGPPERLQPSRSATESLLEEGMLLQHYSKWIDMQIPALGNCTPREAVKTSEGREQVEQLLREFENSFQRDRQQGRTGFDPSLIRQWLGIV